MAALRSRCGHYIFVLWFLLSFFLFSSPNISRRRLGVYHTSTQCHNVALVRMSEMCCTRLAEKYRTQKIAEKSISGHHSTTLFGYIFATKACIDNQKKKLLNSNISSTWSHNTANFGPITAQIGVPVSDTLPNFNGFRVLASLLAAVQRRRSPETNQTLHDLWPSPGLVHYIHFLGFLPPGGILPGAKLTLRPSLPFSYIGSITARTHSSSGHQPNFAAWCKEWNYWTFTDGVTYIRLGGHHVILTCDTKWQFWPNNHQLIVLTNAALRISRVSDAESYPKELVS